MYDRVTVMGISGSGKSTFAEKLAQINDVPQIELDLLNWRANWYDRYVNEFETFKADLLDQISQERWVLAGSYTKVRPLILARSQAVVWLDYPKHLVLRQVFLRSLKRAVDRSPILNGNTESFSRWLDKGHPIQIVLQNYERKKRSFADTLNAPENNHLKVFRCTSRKETSAALEVLSSSMTRQVAT